jgi:Glycosyl hydrolases family 2, TIM barrel domain
MGRISHLMVVVAIVSVFLQVQVAQAQAIPVEVVETADGQWQLLRDGEPYFIKGAGGNGPKEMLAGAGANTFRTWGVGPELGEQLDEAQDLGLTVVVGHWLGHPRHGFDYNDLDMVADQFERVRRDVLAHRDHPALLMWAIGNEMEGFNEGDDAAVWSHVQALAAMIKDLDPNHPTMTVTAEIGGSRVHAVHKLCPDIDIMGINSYGGLPSVPRRYQRLMGTKPFVITEFGPPGTWEIAMTGFGAPPELTSTEKAAVYRDAFTAGCLDAGELCLGGFAFTWGFKVEATATWYGMFLPNGDKLATVDAMTEIWSGKPPADLCPEIRSFGLRGPDVVQPGDTVQVDLDIFDPEGAEVAVNWMITGEVSEYNTGGDTQPAPLELDGIITASSPRGATLVMPGGGVYRLYMTASDGTGGGATANVPIKVDGPVGKVRVMLPLAVYADGKPAPWAPSGWMGTHVALSMDPECTDSPRSGETCLEFTYDEPGMWVGVAWQHPANDWGDKPGGYDLTGAKKLTFWARGKEGGEKLDFGVGLLGSDKKYNDTAKAERKGVKLKREWKRYSIDLEGEDLSRIKTPFAWSLGGRGRPVTFYLDDIRFE